MVWLEVPLYCGWKTIACWSACASCGSTPGVNHQYEARPHVWPLSSERNRSMPPDHRVFGLAGSTAIILSYQPCVKNKSLLPKPHSTSTASTGFVSSSVFCVVGLVLVTWVVQLPAAPELVDLYTASSPWLKLPLSLEAALA